MRGSKLLMPPCAPERKAKLRHDSPVRSMSPSVNASAVKPDHRGFNAASRNDRNRRYLAVAARSGEGPFTYRLQTPNHRALQTVVC